MSWDVDIKKIQCPCGKGHIVQEIRSDDWGRSEDGQPYIECEECKKKYKVVSIHYFELPWKGNGISYFLVPIDLKDDAIYENVYSNIESYDFVKKDFAKYLIYSYKLVDIKEALEQIQAISSCNSANGSLFRIVKDRRKFLRTCKKKELLSDLLNAVNNYDKGANYQLIQEEKERNSMKKKAFEEKIKSIGIRVF